MNNIFKISVLIAFIGIGSCTKDQMPLLIELDNELRAKIIEKSPEGTAEFYILPNETDLDKIPQDPKNVLTAEKVELGKLMFYETALAQDALKESSKGTYSCASCHIPAAGFRPGNFQGIADGGEAFGINGSDRRKSSNYEEDELDVQSARPLSLTNVAYVENTFWNGQFGATAVNEGTQELWHQNEATELNFEGFHGIETQNMEGLHTHRIAINKPLLDSLGYTPLFDAAFADIAVEDRYTRRTASFAFSAYIRTLLTNQAPFQDWLKGNNDALGYDEKKGGILFFGKANCTKCHYNENLGSLEFHVLGVNDMDQIPSFNTSPDDRRNKGRGGFTLKEEDYYKFKVPQLYNMRGTEFYFHGSSKRSIEDLIDYKNLAKPENPRIDSSLISPKFIPLGLTDMEKTQLVAFIKNALYDPNLERYQPTSVLSGQCFPNADIISQEDLNCGN